MVIAVMIAISITKGSDGKECSGSDIDDHDDDKSDHCGCCGERRGSEMLEHARSSAPQFETLNPKPAFTRMSDKGGCCLQQGAPLRIKHGHKP